MRKEGLTKILQALTAEKGTRRFGSAFPELERMWDPTRGRRQLTSEEAKVDRLVKREERREEMVGNRLSVSFEGLERVRGERRRDCEGSKERRARRQRNSWRTKEETRKEKKKESNSLIHLW